MTDASKKIVYAVIATVVVIAIVAVLILNNHKPGATLQENDLNESAMKQTDAPTVSVNSVDKNADTEGRQVEGKTTKPPTEPSVEADIPSLAETFANYFPIGAAIEPNQTVGLNAELLKKHVNWLVAENVMKPDAIQPTEGNFTWDNADKIVRFAKENGMEVRYHTLVWHNQVGAWFFKDAEGKPMVDETDLAKREANKKLLLKRLETHVRAIVGRYKDDIHSWDVVNEVIEPGDPDGMRASDWYKITGTDYIETAFRAAREAGGSEAKLYINDYGTDNPAKRDRMYELLKGMLDKGVPIDGVGHQTHIGIHGPTVDSIVESMQKFGELGLDNLVTELDMSIYAWNDRRDLGEDIPDDLLEKQADRYRELFEAFRANKDILSGVVFWGIADDHTWLHSFPVTRTDAPLLFDKQMHAKQAFWAVVDPSGQSKPST
ncbi:endo-1,4-beta-xylanase [Paenibacillus castaneae]|uniref:endo-1,4-beta-xylanase n=1 Tax=Paenibacillus castaneae TaxID=474957 RepID=UPI000C9B5E36|nr:endo-1,4-beta-xylanase [Paenibacillus castaneae]NIK77034.1 endo-1,4-beta-xylanase [Paenibacillus castaneae]